MDPLDLLLQQYGIGPSQDTLVGEDGMEGPGLPQGYRAPDPAPSAITNAPVGQALTSASAPEPSKIPDWVAGMLGLRPPGPAIEGSPLARRQAGEKPTLSPRSFPVQTYDPPAPSPHDPYDPGRSPEEKLLLDQTAAAAARAPGEKPAGAGAAPTAAPALSPLQQLLMQRLQGEGGPSPAGQSALDKLVERYTKGGMGGGSGSSPFEKKMEERLAAYQRDYKPLEVPEQEKFNRSSIDHWLELAAPKEPSKKTWQDMLLAVGLGMTQAGGRPGGFGKGWGGLGALLAGGAEGFAGSLREQREDQLRYEEARRGYAGTRANTELGLEQARIGRADNLNALKLDVAKANMGDKQAMLKVGLEIDKAVEESRRGNASLGNAKMSILMQAAQFKEQMGLKREELNQRLLLGLARTEAFGNGKAVPITIAPGVKIDAKTTTDDQLASMGVQRLAQGDGSGLATFFPADVLQTLRAQTREEVLRKPGKLAMLGPKAMQDEINAQLVPKLQNWLMANNPDATARRKALAMALRNQIQQRTTNLGGAGIDPRNSSVFDDEDF